MSQGLLVKRQKIAKHMRKQQLDSYMLAVRQKLISQSQQEQLANQNVLVEEQLEHLKYQMGIQNFTEDAIISFLKRLLEFSPKSLCVSLVFVYVNRGLEKTLFYGQIQDKSKTIQQLAEKLIRSVLTIKPVLQERFPLQFCYKDIMTILSNHNFQLHHLWQTLALVRSEVFFRITLFEFNSFITSYPEEITTILTTILDTYVLFTTCTQESSEVVPSVGDLANIISKMSVILKHFNFGDEDLIRLLEILQNMLKLHYLQGIIDMISSSTVLDDLLEYAEKYKEFGIKAVTVLAILELVARMLTGSNQSASKVLDQHPKLISILGDLLPVTLGFSQFNPQSPFQQHYDLDLIYGAMLCLSNIAAIEFSTFSLLKYNIFHKMIAMANFGHSFVKGEIAIFLMNAVVMANDEQLEIILERNLLDALNQAIQEDNCMDAIKYGLLALRDVLKRSQSFPHNNLAWHFSGRNVQRFCKRMGLYKRIEGLVVIKLENISNLADQCLQLFHSNQGNEEQA